MLNSRFSGDTCTALENFQENPYNNSLSSILPCDELLSARPVLFDVSAGIYNLVNEVNVIVVSVHMLPEQSILLIKWNLLMIQFVFCWLFFRWIRTYRSCKQQYIHILLMFAILSLRHLNMHTSQITVQLIRLGLPTYQRYEEGNQISNMFMHCC